MSRNISTESTEITELGRSDLKLRLGVLSVLRGNSLVSDHRSGRQTMSRNISTESTEITEFKRSKVPISLFSVPSVEIHPVLSPRVVAVGL